MLYKQHNRELGLSLWPPKKGQEPWTCVFFLENLKQVYIPITDIADFAGYRRNFIVQGFMPLNEKGIQNILKKFGSCDKFLEHYSQLSDEEISDLEDKPEITAHSEAEMLLLKIGNMLSYDTYTPDKSKEGYGEKIGDYCLLKQVPKRFLGDLATIIKEIDVIWFKDEVPKYAFEIEHTTKIGSGFQRLFQLNSLSAKLFIVSSQKNYPLYAKFIETDPYYRYKGNFHFRNYRQLEEYFRAVSQFEAINKTFLDAQV